MMRKFRKIFRPTTTLSPTNRNENIPTISSPESISDETSYVKQVSSSINKQLFTGRQKNFFLFLLNQARLHIKDKVFVLVRFIFHRSFFGSEFVVCLFFGTKCI
jgi:hypothetical protein